MGLPKEKRLSNHISSIIFSGANCEKKLGEYFLDWFWFCGVSSFQSGFIWCSMAIAVCCCILWSPNDLCTKPSEYSQIKTPHDPGTSTRPHPISFEIYSHPSSDAVGKHHMRSNLLRQHHSTFWYLHVGITPQPPRTSGKEWFRGISKSNKSSC